MTDNKILKEIKRRDLDISKGEMEACILRGCFQTSCTEWNMTSMDEKVEAIKELITNGDFTTLKLSLSMLDTCTNEYNKEIEPIDLVIAMSEIIDYLLKDKVESKSNLI